MNDNAITVRSSVTHSDRGRSDAWFAPFGAYSHELATEVEISRISNAAAPGEGKWLHDQIGGTFAVFIIHRIKIDKIKFGPKASIATKIEDYSNKHFNESKTDSIELHFHDLPVAEVKVHKSPLDSLEIGGKGITECHCAVIYLRNKMQFRKLSCSCDECINSDFRDNWPHTKYCGKWICTKPSKYPKCSDAKHVPKQKRIRGTTTRGDL